VGFRAGASIWGDILDSKAIAQRESHLAGEFAGAINFTEPGFVPDPGGLAKAYAALFGRKGGRSVVGDARTREQSGGRWRVATLEGALTAREVVVAMGPWSDQVFAPLGYSIPLTSSAGIICILSRAATPCSIIPYWIPISAMPWRR